MLGKEKVPNINDVVSIVRSKESRIELMLTPSFVESSSSLIEKSSTMLVNQKKLEETYVEKKGEGCGVLIATSLVILEKNVRY